MIDIILLLTLSCLHSEIWNFEPLEFVKIAYLNCSVCLGAQPIRNQWKNAKANNTPIREISIKPARWNKYGIFKMFILFYFRTFIFLIFKTFIFLIFKIFTCFIFKIFIFLIFKMFIFIFLILIFNFFFVAINSFVTHIYCWYFGILKSNKFKKAAKLTIQIYLDTVF